MTNGNTKPSSPQTKTEQTKHALAMALMNLLLSHPISEISVNDIANNCGVNRNTFYYHFPNIGALVEYYVETLVDDLIKEHPPHITSLEECFSAAIDFSIDNAGIIKNIYHSTNRAVFEQHLWHLCDYAVSAYISSKPKDILLPDTGEELYVLREFLKFELFGFTIDYLNHDMPIDAKDRIQTLVKVLHAEN